MKLIQTNDYLLLIDEETEIKINESTYDFEICPCFGKNKHTEGIVWSFDDKRMHIENFIETAQTGDSGYDIIKINGYLLYPIIAYYPLTKEAKELDLPLLPNPFEIDIEKLANSFKKERGTGYNNIPSLIRECFLAGYKAAQSKQFNLEDIKKAVEIAQTPIETGIGNYYPNVNEVLEQLSNQQLPKEFIPEYDRGSVDFWTAFYKQNMIGIDNPDQFEWNVLKTITNSLGKQELVGTYKY